MFVSLIALPQSEMCSCFFVILTLKRVVFMFLSYPYPEVFSCFLYPYPEVSCVHVSPLSYCEVSCVHVFYYPYLEVTSVHVSLLSLTLKWVVFMFLYYPYPEVSCVHPCYPYPELRSSVFVVLVLKLAVFMWHVFLLNKSVVCLFLCSLHPQQDAHCVTFFFTLSQSSGTVSRSTTGTNEAALSQQPWPWDHGSAYVPWHLVVG